MSTTKGIAKNFSWLLGGAVLSSLINFFTTIYVARILGASAFGLFVFAQAFLMYLVLIVDSGLSILGTREIAKEKENAGTVSINILAVRLILAFFVFIVATLIVLFLPLYAELKYLFIATFIFVFYRAINVDWAFQGLEKMNYISMAKVFFSILSFLLMVFFIKGSSSLPFVPLIQSVAGVSVSFVFIFILFKFVPFNLNKIKFQSWSNYFIYAIPLGASMILVQIYNNIDTIMLGFMSKPEVVGNYNSAYKLLNGFVGLFALWQSTAIPVVTKRINENIDDAKRFLEKYMRLTMLVVIPFVVLVFSMSPLLIKLFFGSEYLLGISALQILIWTFIFIAIGSTYGMLILVPAGKFNHFFLAVLVGALINIFLNFILIPSLSYIGSAIATILAEVSATVIIFYFSRKVLKLNILKYLIIPVFLSIIAFVCFNIAFLMFALFSYNLKMILSGCVFILVYLITVLSLERLFIFSFAKEILGLNNATT